MTQADALSRRPDFVPEHDMDNENITMLPNELFVQLVDLDLQEKISNCNDLDTDATEALKTILEKGPSIIKGELDDWTMETINQRKIGIT